MSIASRLAGPSSRSLLACTRSGVVAAETTRNSHTIWYPDAKFEREFKVGSYFYPSFSHWFYVISKHLCKHSSPLGCFIKMNEMDQNVSCRLLALLASYGTLRLRNTTSSWD